VKYNVSKRIDLEGRAMYNNGDDEFDGGGETVKEWPYNQIVKNV
jgi:hypothetical protein